MPRNTKLQRRRESEKPAEKPKERNLSAERRKPARKSVKIHGRSAWNK